MMSDGGGWTIIYSTTGAASENSLVSDVSVGGNPLVFDAYCLTNLQKRAIDAVSTNTLLRRTSGAWIRANKALNFANLLTSVTQEIPSGLVNILDVVVA